jgi:hypothetical protein
LVNDKKTMYYLFDSRAFLDAKTGKIYEYQDQLLIHRIPVISGSLMTKYQAGLGWRRMKSEKSIFRSFVVF